MPIHLNALSRRRFLHGASILTLAPTASHLAAAPTGTETWALLSDTHIASDPEKTARNINMADQLRQVVAEVMTEKSSLTGVIIDGDCAFNDGQAGDYEVFAEILAPLEKAGLPIHCTLGNHDDREAFFGAFASHAGASPVEAKHCSLIETPLADWILLDTLRFVNKVEGEIGAKQLEWLARHLSENPDKPAIIVGHHYPQVFRTDVIPGDQKIKISGLIDSDPFLKLLADHPAAKAYLYGHSHDWGLKQDEHAVHHVNLPPTSYVFDPKRPGGWVRATLSPRGLSLELRALDTAHAQHGEKHELTWR